MLTADFEPEAKPADSRVRVGVEVHSRRRSVGPSLPYARREAGQMLTQRPILRRPQREQHASAAHGAGTAPVEPDRASRLRRLRLLLLHPEITVLAAILLLGIYLGATNPYFLEKTNLFNIAAAVSVIGTGRGVRHLCGNHWRNSISRR